MNPEYYDFRNLSIERTYYTLKCSDGLIRHYPALVVTAKIVPVSEYIGHRENQRRIGGMDDGFALAVDIKPHSRMKIHGSPHLYDHSTGALAWSVLESAFGDHDGSDLNNPDLTRIAGMRVSETLKSIEGWQKGILYQFYAETEPYERGAGLLKIEELFYPVYWTVDINDNGLRLEPIVYQSGKESCIGTDWRTGRNQLTYIPQYQMVAPLEYLGWEPKAEWICRWTTGLAERLLNCKL